VNVSPPPPHPTHSESLAERTALIFDFGGGTLDASLVKLLLSANQHINIQVLMNYGDMNLGGNYIDTEFMDEFTRRFPNSHFNPIE
jgi:molecular chaperone DnaK (HSP70)